MQNPLKFIRSLCTTGMKTRELCSTISRRNKVRNLMIFDDNFKSDNFAYFFIKTYVVGAH